MDKLKVTIVSESCVVEGMADVGKIILSYVVRGIVPLMEVLTKC